MLKYFNYDIVFQEVPDEVTLAVNITACPNRCKGCHSPYLQDDIGAELNENEIDKLLMKYKNSLTCFCFMGGDAHPDEVEKMAKHIHNISDLKVAWYSGRNQMPSDLSLFQYVKLGPYIPEKGNLKSKSTNQRFYRIINDNIIDMTYLFCK